MSRTIRTLALFVSGTVLLSFLVLVVNQTVQVVQLANQVHPTFGTITLVTLLTMYAGLVGVPVVMVLRLPAPLVPPATDEGPEFDLHLERLGRRLGSSPHVRALELPVSNRAEIEAALEVLSERADELVRTAAASVFVATAVSQSGRLDGLVVLAAQSRMIWRIAHLYAQRPGLREVASLYVNVAATSFVAGELQEIDLAEQVEPVLSAAAGALGASIPGLQAAGSLLAGCVLDGSANAFLTLRVGMIAKRQCGALVVQPRAAVRRAATTEAARLLGGIVRDGTARLSGALWRASADKVKGAVTDLSGKAKVAGNRLVDRIRAGATRILEQPEVG